MNLNSIANILKKVRLSKSLNQNEMADVLNVSIATYQRWENSKAIPSLETLSEISTHLGVDIYEFLGCSSKVYDENIAKEIGTRIQLMRKRSSVENAALSRLLDIPVAQIERWEKGKDSIPSDILYRLATCLNTTIDFLLTGVECVNDEKLNLDDIAGVLKLYHDYIDLMKVRNSNDRAVIFNEFYNKYLVVKKRSEEK